MTVAAPPAPGASGRPASVFLSYSRDDRGRVAPIIAALEAAGFSVWWDGLLQPGERFAETTAAALAQARAVVVLWSPVSVTSHWVHDEATRGRDRRCLVPLSVDGAQPPLGFGQFQTIDVTGRRPGDAALAQLVAAVAALHDASAPPLPPDLPPATAPRPNRRLLLGAAAGLVAAGAGVAAWQSGLIGGSRAPGTVAVLPFANLSGDRERDYLADGIAAEIRAELARDSRLVVAAQTSSDQFRDRTADARTIARRLGVAHLLDGSVQASGSQLRIAAELISGETGFAIWSATFERAASDVFAVQDEIAAAVSSALVSRLFNSATGRDRAAGGTANLAAYDAYLKGRHLYDAASSEADDRAALAAFLAALAADPGYGLAAAARARSLTAIANLYVQGAARRALFADAIASGRQAVAMAPACAEAHGALGFALFNGALDARAARAPFERAAQLGQGDADVLARSGLFAARCGRIDEARPAMARAQALDPLNARTAWQAGEVEHIARNFSAAIAAIERALTMNPKLGVARWTLGAARLMSGDVGGAAAAFAGETNGLFRLAGQAIALHRQGRTGPAQAALADMVSRYGDNALYQQAQVLSAWGDSAAALAALARARDTGDAGIMYMNGDPLLDPLRRDPRFARLRQQLGFA